MTPIVPDPWHRRLLEYERESSELLASMNAADAEQERAIADLERARLAREEKRRRDLW